MSDPKDVEFIEQTYRNYDPNGALAESDGYVTFVERWEPALPGEYAPMVQPQDRQPCCDEIGFTSAKTRY